MSRHKVVNIIFLAAAAFVLYGIIFEGFSVIILVALLFVRAGIIIYGSFALRSGYFLKSVSHSDTGEKIVAISFDDGPTSFTPAVLELLEKYNAQASFFCIGKQIEKFPGIFQQILESGHTTGNHTYTHSPWIGFFSKDSVKEEILQTDEIIKKHAGAYPFFFRPPYGVTNPSVAKAVKETGHKVIGWNIRSFDTFFKNENFIFRRIIRQIKPGSIILLHDTSEKTVKVTELLLDYLRHNGYRSTGIEQMLKNQV